MQKRVFCISLFIVHYAFYISQTATAQTPYSERMAATVMEVLHRDSIAVKEGKPARWDYEQGLVLKAIEALWYKTGDAKYLRYIQKDIDRYVAEDGSIRTYDLDEYNIDNLPTGRALLLLYQETRKEKYQKAAFLLRNQLRTHPRTKAGGFWHKKRYPNQMWLDGLYMAEPFYAEFSQTFGQPENFDDIVYQFQLIESHLIDPKTGLLYHGYDESRQQRWANPQTGCSPEFWGRAMGWYAMALVDVLDYFPKQHYERPKLVAYLNRLMAAVVKYQDTASGGWYQVLDKGSSKGNYLEASATAMFTYTLAKGVRMGYLPASYLPVAQKAYAGMLKNFVQTDANNFVHLDKTVSVGGLGGEPYRSGSYEYYLSEPIKKDDLKGVGPFILASVEIEKTALPSVGKGKTVALDYFFNHEFRKNKQGQMERFHYTWEDKTDSGFWWWGRIFEDYGAKLAALTDAPTVQNLKNANVYIIVDADSPKESPAPNYVENQHIEAISAWVKAGGTLVLMANDTANAEIPRFNKLAQAFGVSFTAKNRNMVKNDVYEQGKVLIPEKHFIFKSVKKVFIKEFCTLLLQKPAQAALTDEGDVVVATANVGKGKVFVIGDPWLYNEYVSGKRLPMQYENFEAAKNLAEWLLK
jgi:unsaturated rhamnogalacturonyl hydrolase